MTSCCRVSAWRLQQPLSISPTCHRRGIFFSGLCCDWVSTTATQVMKTSNSDVCEGISPKTGQIILEAHNYFNYGVPWEYIGEGNGNPLRYSCLENPMDRGARRATVYGVAKSRTRLSHIPVPMRVRLIAQSCPTVCDPLDCTPARLSCPWDFPSKNT